MLTWWQETSITSQVLWVLALSSTSFFVLGTLLSTLGFGDADVPDAEVSLGGEGAHGSEILEALSLRNILAFTLGFSWGGILFDEQVGAAALLLGVPCGLIFTYVNSLLTRKLRGLETSGNANLSEAIGQRGRVSVEVDENLSGTGKVIVRVRERELELLAQTEDDRALRRGDQVQVYNVENGILWVSKEDRLGLERF